MFEFDIWFVAVKKAESQNKMLSQGVFNKEPDRPGIVQIIYGRFLFI